MQYSAVLIMLVSMLFTPAVMAEVISDAEVSKVKIESVNVPGPLKQKIIKKLQTDSTIHNQVKQAMEQKNVEGVSEVRFRHNPNETRQTMVDGEMKTEYKVTIEFYGPVKSSESTAMIYAPGEQYAYADNENVAISGYTLGGLVIKFLDLILWFFI